MPRLTVGNNRFNHFHIAFLTFNTGQPAQNTLTAPPWDVQIPVADSELKLLLVGTGLLASLARGVLPRNPARYSLESPVRYPLNSSVRYSLNHPRNALLLPSNRTLSRFRHIVQYYCTLVIRLRHFV